MRLCAHVRLNRGIAKHLYRNRINETYSLTPECMLDNIAYKTSESINASSSCLELLAKFLLKDIVAMLFLQGLLHARKQLQKYAFFSIPMLKKIRFAVKIQKTSDM